MRYFINKCSRALMWRLRALLQGKRHTDEQFNKVLSHFIKDAAPSPLIFDVGAHRGESVERFKTLFASAIIHSFEPDQDNFTALEEKCATLENVVLNNCGVSSAKGSLTFYKNLKSSTSGFSQINKDSQWAQDRSARYNVSPDEYTQASYDVPVIDLDSYIEKNDITRIHLLKIDTQGHEDEVLKGCRAALEKGLIDVIETELIVGNPYMKSLQFYDLEKILIPAGYRFYGIDHHDDLLNTPSLCFNVIYVRKGL